MGFGKKKDKSGGGMNREPTMDMFMASPEPQASRKEIRSKEKQDKKAAKNAPKLAKQLFDASTKGDEGAVQRLLHDGAKPTHVDTKTKENSLHRAAFHGNVLIVDELIRAGADPNARNAQGKTPLDVAQTKQNLKAIDAIQTAMMSSRGGGYQTPGGPQTPGAPGNPQTPGSAMSVGAGLSIDPSFTGELGQPSPSSPRSRSLPPSTKPVGITLVVGTGLIGMEFIRQMAERKRQVKVLAIDAEAEALKQLEMMKADVHQGDLKDPIILERLCRGVTTVVSTVEPDKRNPNWIKEVLIDGQKNLIDACLQAKVKRFFPSDFGLSPKHKFPFDIPLVAAKGIVNKYLEQQGLEYTIIHGGLHIETFLTTDYGNDLPGRTMTIFGQGNKPFPLVCMSDLVRYAVESIGNWATRNLTVEVASDFVTGQQATRIAETARGKTLSHEFVTVEKLEDSYKRARDPIEKSMAGLRLVSVHGLTFPTKEAEELFGHIELESYQERLEKVCSELAVLDYYMEAFQVFDTDNSGNISITELGVAMRGLGVNPTEKELQALMKEYDADGSGYVEFNEFCLLMDRYADEDPDARFRKAFEVFDRDGNGYLTADELQELLLTQGEKMTVEEVYDVLREADVDGDGKLNYSEFVQMITR